jgi:Tol biopolymer transport system component
MPLQSGTKLGPYEILAPIGAGGMGEVYRAKDTRLDRTVAIKVLPSHLSTDATLRQRFEREARAISALQHPHICTLHDIGIQGDVDFLVMEYLEGETLAQRLTKGALPFQQAITIGIEISQALEEAHRRGIVHRDLKPANIMLTKSGAKLMDFGLAKPEGLVMAAGGSGSGSGSGPFTPSSPTMHVGSLTSAPSPLTQKGTFVGTCQYMAPEVLQGAEADARSDIFSFGCVLYEMVTGKRAFEAKTQLGVLSAILEKEPEPISTVQPLVSPALDRLVQGCMIKDPAERFQSMHDVTMDLRWLQGAAPEKVVVAGKGFTTAQVLTMAAGFLFLTAGAGLLGYWWSQRSVVVPQLRAEIGPPDKFTLDSTGDSGGMPVLSPQGDKIAFVAHSPTTKTLWVRSLESDTAQQLEGTQNAMHPFWSPDGKWIAFFANGKLNKIPAAGGSVTPLADVTNPRGGSWGRSDVIVYSANILDGLMRVSANGGEATRASTRNKANHEDTHRWPWFLPDGKHFLYLAVSHTAGDTGRQGIYFASLDSATEAKLVVTTSAAAQYASGYLLFHQNSDLMAQPFDPSSGKLSGAPETLVNNVRNDSGVWRSIFSTSQNGMLIYQTGSAQAAGTRMAWFDLTGKELQQIGDRANTAIDIRLSPNGKQVAVAEADGLWIWDTDRKTRNRVTFSSTLAEQPSWSPDGKTLLYATGLQLVGIASGTDSEIRTVPADGSGTETVLLKVQTGVPAPAWSGDGKWLAYLAPTADRQSALWIKPRQGDGPAKVILQAPGAKSLIWMYRISPDSKWVAYSSDESGQTALYIARFPEGTGKWRVSVDSGSYPAWSGDGKNLFYKDFNDDFWVAPVKANGDEMEVGTPRRLFHAGQPGLGVPLDVSPDGQRLLVNLAEDEIVTPLKIMTNWPELLKK